MKKFIPVLLGSLFTLGAYAQSSATMDAANQTIINACREEKGIFISFKDDKCEYSGCAYVGVNGDVNYNGDNERVVGGCNIADYRNKARNQYRAAIDKDIADKKAQRDKEIADLERARKEADRIGQRSGRDKYDINGDGVVDSKDDLNGDGVVDDKDLEEAARRIGAGASGSGSGASTSGSGVGGGKGEAGSGSGSNSGSVTVGDNGAIYCEELEGNGSILPGGACYNECKPKRSITTLWLKKKEGLDRKSCVECLYNNQHIYKLKAQYLPKDKNGRTIGDRSVNLGAGVAVKTGVIICKDSKGNVVSATSSGTCPSGTVLHTTTGAGGGGSTIIVGGSGVTSGAGIGGGVGGSISIGGGVGSGTGGVSLPSYCNSPKQKDIDKCNDWMQQNRRFLCSSSSNVSACLGGAEADIYARYNTVDCVNCGSSRRRSGSTAAEILGAIVPGVAQLGSAYMGSRAITKSNQAWANAAKAGFEQCRLSQNDYMQYLQANELPALTPAQQQGMNCNGYSLGGYAGLGGGLNGFYGNGYTNGFLGGMMGPYGMYNPYGMGGMIGGGMGGFVTGGNIGLATGIVGGGYMSGGYMSGGYMSGGYMNGGYMSGGYINGGNIGLATGIVGGGYISGGYAQGGYMTGGYMSGGYMNGGYMNGGYMSGGYVNGGGLVNGVSIAGGVVSGYMNGGYAQGGYMTGGYMSGGYMTGGYAQGGYINGGYAAGGYMNGGYMAGGMGMAGGYNPQITNMDQMRQQNGTMYQMQQLQGGSAGYYPSNMGMGLGFNANLGLNFGAY